MTQFNLPADLIAFLQAGKQLEYDPDSVEPGRVGLLGLEELELGVVWVDGSEAPWEEEDPHAGEEGYYEVPAVNLTGECEAYDPEYLLLWLPDEQMFGTWDSDHWDLRVFPGRTWTDIASDPAPYLDAVWNDTGEEVSHFFRPFPKYPFREGRPF